MAQQAELYMDGNMWCAAEPGFIDPMASHAGFGPTKEEAVADLNRQLAKVGWWQKQPDFPLTIDKFSVR